eukprot:snap_masked-scaffold30_size591359-processed-gene-4.18 protein:Tk12762 transcript:snap_masked-scaffold30_size591359-processed-gene-4.18-mRNA-1 annotation:"AGAP011128-PA"
MQVSWVRHNDVSLISVGKYQYIKDPRFKILHEPHAHDWILRIQAVKYSDEGLYECQVNTSPLLRQPIHLHVVDPQTEILGGKDMFINQHSIINLTCLIHSPDPPAHVFWLHNQKPILPSLPESGETRVSMSRSDQSSSSVVSYLIIEEAGPNDSGVYQCNPSNTSPASLTVHVLDVPAEGYVRPSAHSQPSAHARPSAEFHFSHTLDEPSAIPGLRPSPAFAFASGQVSILELASNFAPVVAERNLPFGQTEPKILFGQETSFTMGGEGHFVFVYGTLKQGEPNHHWLKDGDNGKAALMGEGITMTQQMKHEVKSEGATNEKPLLESIIHVMDEKRQEIATLLRAGYSQVNIMTTLNVSKTMVYNAKKRLDASGDARRYHGGGRRSVRTKALETAVKAKVRRNPRRSVRKLARDHNLESIIHVMDEKRQEIATLLRAGYSQVNIMTTLNVSKTMVYNAKKRLDASGDARRYHGGGRPRSVRTKALETAVKAKVRRNPRRSVRKLARDHNVSRKTMRSIVEDLGLTSRVIPTRQLITEASRVKRIERYPLVIASKFNIPFLLNIPNEGHLIKGEVYNVDEEKLQHLDWHKLGHAMAAVIRPRLGEDSPMFTHVKAMQVALNDVAQTISGSRRVDDIRIQDLMSVAKLTAINHRATVATTMRCW